MSSCPLEISMKAHSSFVLAMARRWPILLATATLGVTWGCGEIPSHTPPDEGGTTQVQKTRDNMKKFMEKRQALEVSAKKKPRR